MGFRYRKSKSFGPARINVSKSGLGYSIGTKWFRYTKTANGRTRKTYSIPGTGISYVDEKSSNNNNKNKNTLQNNQAGNIVNEEKEKKGGKKSVLKKDWNRVCDIGRLEFMFWLIN